MTLLAEIKNRFLKARKDRNIEATAALGTFVGEAQMIGKSDGNRETTDAEVTALLKKFIKNAHEVYEWTSIQDNINAAAKARIAKMEIELFSSFLPAQLTGVALSDAIVAAHAQVPNATIKDMGKIMAALKAKHDGQFDGAEASKQIKALLNTSP